MTLTRLERERLTDSQLKVQSVARNLKRVDPKKLADFADIQDCLEDAGKSIADALRSSESHR